MTVPELDLTAGALAIKRVSGVAGVRDDVVLSVLSGLVSSGTCKGSWAGLIAWWLCWRSSRLDSTYRKASVRTSLCPKSRLSALKVPTTRNFLLAYLKELSMKNGVYSIVIANLVAELFKILIYAN